MKHKQREVFYLYTSIGNLDNSVDLSTESPETFDNLNDAVEAAKYQTSEFGVRTCVYKCTPVVQIDRGRLRVKKL